MRLKRWALSPVNLFVTTWSLALFAAILGPTEEVHQLRGVETTFTFEGFLWIGACLVTFFLGAAAANRRSLLFKSNPKSSLSEDGWDQWTMRTGFVFVSIFTFLLVNLLIYWTLLAVGQVGSVTAFLQLLSQEWAVVRRIWPDQKPFTGARVLYTSLVAVAIFSATGIALVRLDQRSQLTFRPWIRLLLLSSIPLMILPLLISQRILLAMAIIGAVVVYVLIYPKGISLKIPILGGIIGFVVWTAQETIRTDSGGLIDSILNSTNTLLFYFAVGVGDINRMVSFMSNRSYGFESAGFIFQYLFMRETIANQYLNPFYGELSIFRAGGPIPALATPYVDFGVFGLILIFIWGYISQVAYLRSSDSIFAAQIYGLIASSIILSWHTTSWSSVTFWTNVAFLTLFTIVIPKMYLTIRYGEILQASNN